MCQRRQKSWRLSAAYGESKFRGNVKPSSKRDPDRDIRVAGEVGVDLDGVRVDPDQELERRVLPRRTERLVDDARGEVVRDHDLLEQAGRDQVERRLVSTRRGLRGVSSCGISSPGRTIGPATRCGKNET